MRSLQLNRKSTGRKTKIPLTREDVQYVQESTSYRIIFLHRSTTAKNLDTNQFWSVWPTELLVTLPSCIIHVHVKITVSFCFHSSYHSPLSSHVILRMVMWCSTSQYSLQLPVLSQNGLSLTSEHVTKLGSWSEMVWFQKTSVELLEVCEYFFCFCVCVCVFMEWI